MADRWRLVRLPDGGVKRPVVVRDLADGLSGGRYVPVRDSGGISAPSRRPIMADAERAYGGSRQVAQTHENATFTKTLLVKGSSAQDALDAVDDLLADLENWDGLFIEWRPDGVSYSTYLEVRGAAAWTPKYSWAQFAGAKSLEIDISVPVAPLGRGDALDITDTFSEDSRGDYTFDAGTAANATIAGGTLSLVASARMIHTARGHKSADVEVLVSCPASSQMKLIVKRLDATNWIEFRTSPGGWYKIDNGVETLLGAAGISISSGGWLRARIIGNVLTADLLSSEVPTANGGVTQTVTLAGADATKFGAGVCGYAGIGGPAAGTAKFNELRIRPHTFVRTLPDQVRLVGVPGSAPALVDWEISTNGGAAPPISALVGWAKRAAGHNLVWNGDFEDANTDGWSTAIVANYNTAAATSISTSAVGSPGGLRSAVLSLPATIGAGANFRIFRRFRAGVTYRLELYANDSGSGSQVIVLKLGNASGSDQASASVAPGSINYGTNLIGVDWTPTADTDIAYLSIANGVATARTLTFDTVRVYEKASAPSGVQAEGAGGYPPFGILKAEACDTGDLSGWAITADANYLGGFGLKITTSGAGTAAAAYYLDPALMAADDYSDEMAIEVWAVVEINVGVVSPRLILSALPEYGYGGTRYTGLGSGGKSIVKPSAGTVKRLTRLGRIRLSADGQDVRWKLRLEASWATGSAGLLGVDYLIMVPAAARQSSKGGVANDAAYPDFAPTVNAVTKVITSDLRGRIRAFPRGYSTDSGLGGSPGELPPGDVVALLKLSSLVADNPTSDTTTEQLTHAAVVHAAVIPRYQLARPA